jgi:hypothetical protein
MSGTGSVYSSTDQINLLKNIFTPQFQVGQGGYFHPTVHTYLPGDVEIGDPTTNYNLFLNGNALATDLKIAAWSGYPAISTLSMGGNSITGVTTISFQSGGNFLTGISGRIASLQGVSSINGFNICLGSPPTIGYDKVFLGSGAGPAVLTLSDQVCIGLSAGSRSVGPSLVAIGQNAGSGTNGSGYVVAVGFNAGLNNSGGQGVFIGCSAGVGNRGSNTVLLGQLAGSGNISSNVVALGYQAALNNTSSEVVAVGSSAGANNSGSFVVAAGYQAGQSNRGSSVVALGYRAGFNNSGGADNCIFLGTNPSVFVNNPNTSSNTFYVYSTQQNTPFLQGDMSANTLGIGVAPTPGFALTVQGSVQNRLNLSTATGTLNLTSANAATRFFVSGTVTLSFSQGSTAGTHWIVTNTSTSAVTANLCGGTVQNSISSVTLPATISGVGRGVTFAYTGTVGNFYSF